MNNAELSSKSDSLLSVCGAGNFALAAGIGEWSLMRQERSFGVAKSSVNEYRMASAQFDCLELHHDRRVSSKE